MLALLAISFWFFSQCVTKGATEFSWSPVCLIFNNCVRNGAFWKGVDSSKHVTAQSGRRFGRNSFFVVCDVFRSDLFRRAVWHSSKQARACSKELVLQTALGPPRRKESIRVLRRGVLELFCPLYALVFKGLFAALL